MMVDRWYTDMGLDLPVYPLALGAKLGQVKWAPVYLERLLDSDFLRRVEPEAGFHGMILWFEAVRQDPAGTLPANAREIMRLCRFKGNIRSFKRLEPQILYNWERVHIITPGPQLVRLQHPVVTEIVTKIHGHHVTKHQSVEAQMRSATRNFIREQLYLQHAPRALLLDDQLFDAVIGKVKDRLPKLVVDEVHAARIALVMIETYRSLGIEFPEFDLT